MVKEIAVLMVVWALLFPQFALASAGWTDYVTVAELVPTDRHYYEFRLAVKKNPSGCKSKSWFYKNYESRGADKMFAALLEGIKSGIKLRVYVTGNCNINGYSEISSISIIP